MLIESEKYPQFGQWHLNQPKTKLTLEWLSYCEGAHDTTCWICSQELFPRQEAGAASQAQMIHKDSWRAFSNDNPFLMEDTPEN